MSRIVAAIIALVIFMPSNAHAFFFFALPAVIGGAAASAAASAGAAATLVSASQIALGVLGLGTKIFAGMAAKNQADATAAQLDLQAKMEETAGLQRDTQRREELERTVGSIRAARGGRGVSSPTAISFLDEANHFVNSDRMVELLNSRQRSADLRTSAQQARSRGRNSLITSSVQGGTSLFQLGAYAARRL